jgi:hypothetical protein
MAHGVGHGLCVALRELGRHGGVGGGVVRGGGGFVGRVFAGQYLAEGVVRPCPRAKLCRSGTGSAIVLQGGDFFGEISSEAKRRAWKARLCSAFG